LIHFLDASALVKRYVKQAGTEQIRRLLRGRAALGASILSSVEVASALARRARAGDLPQSAAKSHGRRAASDLAEMHVIAASREVLKIAVELIWHPLRAYDAIQLASAIRLSRETGLAVTFVCGDERLAAAAKGEGLRALRVGG
jgi:uncharacterized protein